MATAKKPGLLLRAKDFFISTLSGDFDETRKFQRRLQAFIKFWLATIKKFLDDEILLRSASISYAIVVSFVPTLVVVMMLGARFINIEAYFDQLTDMARLGGLQIDLEPYFNVIRDLLKNAGAIGGVGLLVLMFSATSVLRNVESAINKIWRVTRKRPIVQKIAGFVMVIIFGPIVLTVGISAAQWVVQQFAAPNLNQVRIIGDSVQILGDQHLLLVQSEKGKPFREKNILKMVDFKANNRVIVFNAHRNAIFPTDRKDLYDHAPAATSKGLRDAVFTDYAQQGNREFIITGNGILVSSRDHGRTYHARKFYRQRREHVLDTSLKRIQFLTQRDALIIGDEGLILRTQDAGDTWEPVYQTGVTRDLHQIARLRAGVWVILGDDGVALITEDNGATFKPFESLLRTIGNRKVAFTGIAMSERAGYIVGQAGLLLVTRDGGENWRPHTMDQSMFFEDVAVAPDGTAVAVGYKGLIRYSEFLADGSMEWLEAKSQSSVDLRAVRFYAKENRFIIVGDHYHMLAHQIESGKATPVREFKVIQKAPIWRRLISAAGNFLIPFTVIFLLFFLVYKVIPYTQVNSRAAAVGAVFTSVAWVIFLVLYKYYVTNMATGTAALYGTLALVPLTLLLLYISSLIMLFGAELAFFTQYPQLMRMSSKKTLDERHKRQLWYGMSLLQKLAQSFNAGKADCTTDMLIKYCNGDQEEFAFIMHRLKDRGYVMQTDDQHWLLAMNPDLIEVSTLVEDLDPSDYSIPEYTSKNAFMRTVKGYFDSLEESRGKVFRKVTLSALMANKK
jgi:membrane protein